MLTKITITVLGAFILGLILGRVLIPVLRALKVGQSIREVGPSWHNSKAGTPTMGGIVFILAALVCVVTGWKDMLAGDFTHLLVFGFALIFGAIGFLDDFFKVKFHRNLGLTALQKLILQLAAGAIYLFLLRKTGNLTNDLYIPFANITVTIPWAVYLILSMFIIVGCVNAVNLTDGIDGLATGVTMPVMIFFACVAMALGKYTTGYFALALLGGLGAFLCFNFHPAHVFMGDTGSLFLGGAVCGLAYALDMPLVLILVGIIYIIETVSVIMQVTYFKLTHGKRIFLMTPIHHHFEKKNWSEEKIFTVFVGITVVFCLLAYWGVSGLF
jgi:phospho-N-acetylmuramoyl-pentapeptide-transferase